MLRSLTLLLLALSACSESPERNVQTQILPTKDQLWVSEGKSFSASELEALRERFPSLSAENQLLLSQWLSHFETFRREGEPQGRLTLDQYAEDLRNLLPPEPSGFDSRAFSRRLQTIYRAAGPVAWRNELEKRTRQKRFEWNPSLLKDYGISGP